MVEAQHGTVTPRTPSRVGYALALVLLAVGAVAFVLPVTRTATAVADAVDGLHRFVAPGSTTLTVEAPGTVTVYYEKVGDLDGQRFETSPWFRPHTATVTRLDTGEPVPVHTVGQAVIYDVGDRHGNSEWRFEAPAAGLYELTVAAAGGGDDAPVLLAVGHLPAELVPGGWRGVYGGAAVLAFAFTASTLIVILTWARRKAAQQEQRR